MPRFSTDELKNKALAAVTEAATEALKGPIRRTKALRFCLAFLANTAKDRRPFDLFWQEIAEPLAHNEAQDFGRRQTINNLAAVIHRAVGREPPG